MKRTCPCECTESSDPDDITLMIGDEKIRCSKELLVNNSDYFRAMLTGNFIENNQRFIRLKDVNPNTLRDLLSLIRHRGYIDHGGTMNTFCEDPYSVLTVCCMFLFDDLKLWIIERLYDTMTSKNCLHMWMELQVLAPQVLEIASLSLKAKSMSLHNFNEVVENGTIYDFNLTELCSYLGHINLQCDTELSVFQAAMTWIRKQSSDETSDKISVLEKLLHCIDFKHTSILEILQMKADDYIVNTRPIIQILDNILKLKSGEEINETEDCGRIAKILVQSKGRYLPRNPCLMVNSTAKKGYGGDMVPMYEVIQYDTSQLWRKIQPISMPKCEDLVGFGIQDYKNKIYVFGGEFTMNKGAWNRQIWQISFESRQVEIICLSESFPSPRRHFASCICGDSLYVVGGTGMYRVNQDNMYCYDFKTEKWSKEIALPCSGRQIKCCNIRRQLFIFSLSNKCGYFFLQETTSWKKVIIDDNSGLIAFTPSSIFTYRDNIFLKGSNLIELELMEDELKPIQISPLPHSYEDDFVETVSNHNLVYTLYEHKAEEDDKMSLECLNLDTLEVNFIFEFTSKLNIVGETDEFEFRTPIKLFLFHEHKLVNHNTYVNEHNW